MAARRKGTSAGQPFLGASARPVAGGCVSRLAEPLPARWRAPLRFDCPLAGFSVRRMEAPLWCVRPSARPSTRAAWTGMSLFPSCVREKWPERASRKVKGPKSGPRGAVGACTTRKRRHRSRLGFGRRVATGGIGRAGGVFRDPSPPCGSPLARGLPVDGAPSPCRRGAACCRIGRPRGATLRYGAWRCRDTGSRPYRRRSA